MDEMRQSVGNAAILSVLIVRAMHDSSEHGGNAVIAYIYAYT